MVRRHWKGDSQDSPESETFQCNLSVLDQAEQVLDDAAQHVQNMPTYEYVRKVERRSDRNRNVVIAVVLLIAVIALVVGSVAYSDGIRNATQISVNQTALETYQEAIGELRAKGVPEDQLPPPPSTPPSDSPEVNLDGLVNATSAKVMAGIKNNPAFVGPGGPGGPPGADSTVPGPEGPGGAPCDPATNPSCVGSEGAEGQPGTPGGAGTNGVDGQNGTDGQDGADGAEGPKGDAGPKPMEANFGRDGAGTCQYFTSYDDGSVTSAPAPDNMCQPAPVEEPG